MGAEAETGGEFAESTVPFAPAAGYSGNWFDFHPSDGGCGDVSAVSPFRCIVGYHRHSCCWIVRGRHLCFRVWYLVSAKSVLSL